MCGRYAGVLAPSSRWAGGDILALQVSDVRSGVLVLVMNAELEEEEFVPGSARTVELAPRVCIHGVQAEKNAQGRTRARERRLIPTGIRMASLSGVRRGERCEPM